IFSCMSAAVHRGDPIGLLDLDTALQELRQEIKDPGFIKRLVRELLLSNSHRVRVVMKPDRELASRLIEEEQTKLEALRTSFSDAERSNVLELATALKKRQSQKEDLSLLPQVTRADIPPSKVFPVLAGKALKSKALEAQAASGIKLTTARAGTNGITFHQVVSPLPALTTPLLGLLPIYSQLVTEVGSADRNYLETQQAQHSITGGISAFSSFRSDLNDCEDGRGYLTLSSRTLNPKAVEMARLVKETVNEPRFDEVGRIKELVQQLSIRRSNSVASNGHQYAMSAAAASLRPLANISDFLSGIPAIMRLKKLARDINDGQRLESLAASMQQLHDQLRGNSPELLVISEAAFLESYAEAISALWGETVQTEESRFDVSSIDNPGDRAFVVTTQVNYCATVYPTIPESNEDAAALAVLAGVLRNNFLHSEVREKGGAYGGGAGHDSATGVFRFYSYRDPRLMETFEAFSRSIDWALNNDITDVMLEEAVLGIISSVDAPGSPAGEIRQAFHHGLFGRSAEHREATRGRYLDVRQHDLRRVIDTYLHKTPSRAVVTSENRLGEVDNQFEQVFVNE
ncbi:MAG: peptidase M16, partial [Gammaproteobacteria bacterium]|nr:peptidase M16 [Gammaproteobacteria bacterium]